MYEREKTLEQESAQFFSGTCYGDYTAWGVECRKGERTGSGEEQFHIVLLQ